MATVIAKSLFIVKYRIGNYETAYLVIKLRMEENGSETGFNKKKTFKGLVKAQCNVDREPGTGYAKS